MAKMIVGVAPIAIVAMYAAVDDLADKIDSVVTPTAVCLPVAAEAVMVSCLTVSVLINSLFTIYFSLTVPCPGTLPILLQFLM